MGRRQTGSVEDGNPAHYFGRRVRQLRLAAELTLERFAELSGVSRAMLSKVERSEKSPTIRVAARIAKALGVSLSELMGPDRKEDPVVVQRLADRAIFRDPESNFERHVVVPASTASKVELLYHHLPPLASTGVLPPYGLGVEKRLVVTEGQLSVAIDDKSWRLHVGDAMFFKASVPHSFTNPADSPCGYFLIISHGG